MDDNDNKEMKMPVKSFKEYYADPEYKKRHLAHMLTKVECKSCKTMVSRCNMTKHKRSTKHIRIQEVITENSPENNMDRAIMKELFDETFKKYLANKELIKKK